MLSYNGNPCVKESTYTPGRFRQLQASDVRALFDLRASARLPNEFIHRTYEGPRGAITIFIAPREFHKVNQRILRPHRIFVVCPKCLADIPFGRMGQHWRRKDHG